ncbi:MFS general substrate transporter [Ascoidea rubescens DSM 1968]|uniref:MFS general substrate transporter n=1 Tax=Ascoidea rubescens DSM 1968 TaxID=1344418 RepID=A0A1D2VP96_9ASCO|nr:MFS general substrate transporter [Ascoidea rubescens DSM 1968]ODV63442.1 MFS general substrate transporter [Ascoidea rubescens DSM 1968]
MDYNQSNSQKSKKYDNQSFHERQHTESDSDNDFNVQTIHGHPDLEKLNAKSNPNTLSRTKSIVPKNQRRGLLSHFCLIPEYNDPRDFPNKYKNFLLIVVACASIIGPMGTSILLPAMEDVIEMLNTQTYLVNISVGIYLLTLGIFPLWWSAISERKGRRNVYLISFFLMFCFSIGCALSTSIGMLIAFRVLSGAASASVQSVGAGSISDLYAPKERGTAMGLFYLGPLMGPFLAPLIGGAIATRFGFRGTQWFLVIFSGFLDFVILFGLPETLRKQSSKDAIARVLASRRENHEADSSNSDLEKNYDKEHNNDVNHNNNGENINRLLKKIESRSLVTQNLEKGPIVDTIGPINVSKIDSSDPNLVARIHNQDIKGITKEVEKELENNHEEDYDIKNTIYIYVFQPVRSLIFFRYPPVFLAVFFSSITFLPVYINNIALSNLYSQEPYNFGPMLIGLVYLPNSAGYIVASVLGGKYVDSLLKKYEKKYGFLAPEARISYNMLMAIIFFPISLLITGWCFQKETHWFFLCLEPLFLELLRC